MNYTEKAAARSCFICSHKPDFLSTSSVPGSRLSKVPRQFLTKGRASFLPEHPHPHVEDFAKVSPHEGEM